MEDKLSDEKKELEEREANMLNAYNMQVSSLRSDVKKAKMESEMKASLKAQREEDKASADSNLADATATHKEDKKFLADLTAECTMKTNDFQKRQVMRQGEIEAIEKAIEIMSSDDVTGSGEKYLPQFVQIKTKNKRSMSLLRSQSVRSSPPALRLCPSHTRFESSRH